MRTLGIAAKAEVVLGVLLVIRHRTVRLVGLLVLAVVVLGLIEADQVSSASRTVLVASGSLAAVAGSRLLAPGAALGAARRVAGAWWLAPVGRLTGACVAIGPVIAIAAGILAGPVADAATAARLGGIAVCYAVGLGALSLALAPVLGATAAGSIGLVLAWVGPIPPSGIAALSGEWEYVQRPAVILWNVLPLDWRAARWFDAGTAEDLLVFAAWLVAGIVLAAWGCGAVHRGEPERQMSA